MISPETVYSVLKAHYGWQQWWPAETDFEIMVGAILTQGTSWSNVEKAINWLKSNHALDLEKINEMPRGHLSQLIYSTGFHNVKADRLKSLSSYLVANFDGKIEAFRRLPTATARSQLLAVDGIGPETADDILLYAFERPVFVIDSYTRRLLRVFNLISEDEPYETLRQFFETSLKPDVSLFKEYHALIVRHAKEKCTQEKSCLHCKVESPL